MFREIGRLSPMFQVVFQITVITRSQQRLQLIATLVSFVPGQIPTFEMVVSAILRNRQWNCLTMFTRNRVVDLHWQPLVGLVVPIPQTGIRQVPLAIIELQSRIVIWPDFWIDRVGIRFELWQSRWIRHGKSAARSSLQVVLLSRQDDLGL